jgi:hypothetical protein
LTRISQEVTERFYDLLAARSLAVVDHILGDNLSIKAKELRVCRIDRDAHPMCFRVSEGFNTCEVLKPSVGLLAEERLVDKVCVSPWRNATGFS